MKSVNPKGNQFWIFIRRTDAEAPTLWPPDAKNWFIGKDPNAGKDWGKKEKGTTEDEMVGWYHWLHGHEFEQVLGDGDGQGGLACWSPWGHKESDVTERLTWTVALSSPRLLPGLGQPVLCNVLGSPTQPLPDQALFRRGVQLDTHQWLSALVKKLAHFC